MSGEHAAENIEDLATDIEELLTDTEAVRNNNRNTNNGPYRPASASQSQREMYGNFVQSRDVKYDNNYNQATRQQRPMSARTHRSFDSEFHNHQNINQHNDRHYNQHLYPSTPRQFTPQQQHQQQYYSQPPPSSARSSRSRGSLHQRGGGDSQQNMSHISNMNYTNNDSRRQHRGGGGRRERRGRGEAWGMAGSETEDEMEFEAERLFLAKIDRKCSSLQKKGKHLDAVELMEQGIASRVKLFGRYSPQVLNASERLGLLYNSLAMSSLYKERYRFALELLRKADKLTSSHADLVSVHVQTLNNLACCFRRMKKPKKALSLLRQSLAMLQQEGSLDGRAVTHLNMCAILSQLDRHVEALEHAKAAVLHCQKQLLSSNIRKQLNDEYHQHQLNADNNSISQQHSLLTEKIVILGIAYHNLGVEEEFLEHYQACLQWYLKALQLAKEHIGNTEAITQTFRSSYFAAKKQIKLQSALSDISPAKKSKRKRKKKKKRKKYYQDADADADADGDEYDYRTYERKRSSAASRRR